MHFFLFACMYVCMSLFMPRVCKYPQRSEENFESPEIGVTVVFYLFSMGAKNQAQVFCKSSKSRSHSFSP